MDQDLKTRFDQHPYGALAAALGVGYVLGGGFFTPLTERIAKFAVKAGVRAALLPFLTTRLSELVRPAERRETPSTTPPSPSAAPSHQDAP